jgi:hypothetical protein
MPECFDYGRIIDIQPRQKIINYFRSIHTRLFNFGLPPLILHNLNIARATLDNLIDLCNHTLLNSHNLLKKHCHIELGVIGIEFLILLTDDITEFNDLGDAGGLHIFEGFDFELAGVFVDLVMGFDAAGAEGLHADQAVIAVELLVLGAHQPPIHNII